MSIITSKISLSKLTLEIGNYQRISVRNNAKKEVWAESWAEQVMKTFGKGWGYQGTLMK